MTCRHQGLQQTTQNAHQTNRVLKIKYQLGAGGGSRPSSVPFQESHSQARLARWVGLNPVLEDDDWEYDWLHDDWEYDWEYDDWEEEEAEEVNVVT